MDALDFISVDTGMSSKYKRELGGEELYMDPEEYQLIIEEDINSSPSKDKLSDVFGMFSEMIPRYTVNDRRTVTANAIRSPQSAGKINTRTLSKDSNTTGMMVFNM